MLTRKTGTTALLLPAQIHTLYMTQISTTDRTPYETRSMREREDALACSCLIGLLHASLWSLVKQVKT